MKHDAETVQIAMQNVVQMFVQKMTPMQKRFAEMVCRNELQKPCRKNAPMQYCLQMQYVVQNYLQMLVQIF